MTTFKRVSTLALSLLLCFAMLAPLAAAAEPSHTFSDVPETAWYYPFVQEARQKELFAGTGSNAFLPKRNITREEFVTVLLRMYELRIEDNLLFIPEADFIFSDTLHVSSIHYINWAYDEQLISGYGDGTFGPKDPITREQIAVILQNYTQRFEETLEELAEPPAPYVDTAKISRWAQTSVEAMRKAGIFSGREDGKFDPKANTTRAEAAAIFVNYLGALQKES